MIQNIEAGSGFGGLAKYLFSDGKNAKVLGGTFASKTPAELSKEAQAIRKLNPKANKVISHISLSLPPGETLTDEKWAELAQSYIERMGYENCAWLAVRHHDTDHDHIHLGVIRIDMTTGKTVSNSWDFKRGEAIVRELEKEFGLSAPQPQPVSRKMTRNEVNKAVRTGEISHRQRIAEAIDAALETPCTLPDFIDRLSEAGVGVHVNIASTGRISGISFDLDGHVFKGSKIGKSYSWGNLKKRGVSYEKDRDREAVIERTVSADKKQGRERDRGATANHPGDTANSSRSADANESRERTASAGKQATETAENDNSISTTGSEASAGSSAERKESSDSSVNSEVYKTTTDTASDWVSAQRSISGSVTKVSSIADKSVQQTSSSTLAKINAWRKQHSALQAPKYRITLTSRKDELKTFNQGKGKGADGGEKLYTADEVEKLIPYLSAKNAQGYDIYITPMSDEHHYMVLDDSTPAKIQKAIQKYGEPALIQYSSAGNEQAIFIVEKQQHTKEQSLANKLVQRMNKEFGDPNFTGVVHPFRMAGFSNKKPGKNNFFTQIKYAVHVISEKLTHLLEKMRNRERSLELHIERESNIKVLNHMEYKVRGDDAWSQEKRRQIGLAKLKVNSGDWLEVDQSAVDYRTVKELYKNGMSVNEIKSQMSSDLELRGRHPATDDYINRTVDKAVIEVERQAQRSRSSSYDYGMHM